MAATALLLHWRTLLGTRRNLSAALGLCAMAPLVLVGASTLWGATGTAASSSAAVPSSAAFVGEQHVSLHLKEVFTLDLGLWARLFQGGAFSGVIPALIAALSGLLVGR
jgi:hypothetical protein